jgi:ribonuclease T1
VFLFATFLTEKMLKFNNKFLGFLALIFLLLSFNCSHSKENKLENNFSKIPKKVLKVRDYVRKYNHAMNGYVGGRKFKNLEKLLPITDSNQTRIAYQEWDVNPKTKGKNRGKQRLVTGSDGSDYYTADHYNSFIEINTNKTYGKLRTNN